MSGVILAEAPRDEAAPGAFHLKGAMTVRYVSLPTLVLSQEERIRIRVLPGVAHERRVVVGVAGGFELWVGRTGSWHTDLEPSDTGLGVPLLKPRLRQPWHTERGTMVGSWSETSTQFALAGCVEGADF